MKRTFLAAIMVFLILSPIGCGHHDHGTQLFTSSTISNQDFDGDIEQVSVSPALFSITTIAGGAQSVLAGIDFTRGTEFRAFLDFPLSGGVPGTAVIDSAFLYIGITSVSLQSGNSIPIRIELVDIQSPTLTASDYDRAQQPPLAFITFSIFQSDAGFPISVDVTSLMTEAQRLGLANFQIRILEDLVFVSPGLIEINDTTGVHRGDLAPLLQVNYF